jgi:hypothetical protein
LYYLVPVSVSAPVSVPALAPGLVSVTDPMSVTDSVSVTVIQMADRDYANQLAYSTDGLQTT